MKYKMNVGIATRELVNWIQRT